MRRKKRGKRQRNREKREKDLERDSSVEVHEPGNPQRVSRRSAFQAELVVTELQEKYI